MATKRTPPPKLSAPASTMDSASESDFDQGTGGSLPNLADSITHNVNTGRLKRKREGELAELKDEIRELFSNSETEQKNKFANLQAALAEIKTQNQALAAQNADIQASMEILYTKHNDIQKELEGLRIERKEHLSYIKDLETRLDNIERYSYTTKIEIRNIPKERQAEDKEDLSKITVNIGAALGIPIQKSEIRDVYRGFAKPDQIKPLVIEFTSVITKENIMKGLKKFNNKKDNKDKLNTKHLNMNCPETPVYISECLTYKARKLHFLARDFAKLYGYNFCWTSYGKIYLRKAENHPFIRVDDEGVLAKLKASALPSV